MRNANGNLVGTAVSMKGRIAIENLLNALGIDLNLEAAPFGGTAWVIGNTASIPPSLPTLQLPPIQRQAHPYLPIMLVAPLLSFCPCSPYATQSLMARAASMRSRWLPCGALSKKVLMGLRRSSKMTMTRAAPISLRYGTAMLLPIRVKAPCWCLMRSLAYSRPHPERAVDFIGAFGRTAISRRLDFALPDRSVAPKRALANSVALAFGAPRNDPVHARASSLLFLFALRIQPRGHARTAPSSSGNGIPYALSSLSLSRICS